MKKRFVSKFYKVGEWDEKEIMSMLDKQWAVYRVWEYQSVLKQGTLVTFVKYQTGGPLLPR